MTINKKVSALLLSLIISTTSTTFADASLKATATKISVDLNSTNNLVLVLKDNKVIYTVETDSEKLTIANLESGTYYDIIVIDSDYNTTAQSIKTNDTY